MLLPYLLKGLTAAVAPDHRAATYSIVGRLGARATFTADLVNGALSVCGGKKGQVASSCLSCRQCMGLLVRLLAAPLCPASCPPARSALRAFMPAWRR